MHCGWVVVFEIPRPMGLWAGFETDASSWRSKEAPGVKGVEGVFQALLNVEFGDGPIAPKLFVGEGDPVSVGERMVSSKLSKSSCC